MGRRLLTTCDLCKNETSEEALNELALKKQEKKAHKYEICESCYEKLTYQIIENTTLEANWSFQNKTIVAEPPIENSQSEELLEENNIFERHKQREIMIDNLPDIEQERLIKNGPETIKSEGKCKHYNKTPAMTGVVEGKKMFYQKCKDCGIALEPRKFEKRR